MLLQAHPFADILPMMTDEELQDLADSIKDHGQRLPIIVGVHEGKRVVIDGRNRQKACQIAGVEPILEEFDGDDEDIVDFILSANIYRRHITAGQKAMLKAMIYPEPEKGGRGKTKERVDEIVGFSTKLLQRARVVLREDRMLAEAVRDGTQGLDGAYEKVKAVIEERRADEEKFARLRARAPDIAVLITEGKLSLSGGMAAFASREQARKEARDLARRTADRIHDDLSRHVAALKGGIKLGENKLVDKQAVVKALADLQAVVEQMVDPDADTPPLRAVG